MHFQSFRRQLTVILCLLAGGLLGTGCVSPGKNLDRSAISQLQNEQTQAEVRERFGTPKRTETAADGRQLEMYQVRFERKIPVTHRAFILRTLCVLYSADRRVVDFTYSVGELAIWNTPLGWNAGEPLDEGLVRSIKRGVHSRSDLVHAFGPPVAEGLSREGEPVLVWYHIEGRGGFVRVGHELHALLDPTNLVKDFILRETQP